MFLVVICKIISLILPAMCTRGRAQNKFIISSFLNKNTRSSDFTVLLPDWCSIRSQPELKHLTYHETKLSTRCSLRVMCHNLSQPTITFKSLLASILLQSMKQTIILTLNSASSLVSSDTLKMEEVRSPETSKHYHCTVHKPKI